MKEKTKPKTAKSLQIKDTHPTLLSGFAHLEVSKPLLFPIVALLLSFIGYLPILQAEFVNWDDQDYATNNPLIHDFSNFSKFFTTPVQGNFHPLTMISLAVNYAISGLDPLGYHLLNLLFHLVNVFCVYFFIKKLMPGQVFIAFGTALLFGVHPMHVESVAWVSERKDVLYTFFLLMGLIQYLSYIDQESRKHFWYAFAFFVLSILSKPAAIIFPALLFTLDFYRKRKWNLHLLWEKIPFGLVAALFLYLTLHAQTKAGATPTSEFYGWEKRIFFPFYGYMMYIYKLFFPVKLTAFYPLPPINEGLKPAYYISPLVFAATAYWSYKTRNTHREIGFAFSFYFLSVFMVLQLFLVGSAIIAERYTYVPYIGLSLLICWLLQSWFNQRIRTAYVLLSIAGFLCMIKTFQHSKSWTTTAALWDNAIKSYPGAKAYTNRAYVYQKDGKWAKAIDLYTKSLQYNVIDAEVYYNMGVAHFNLNQDSLAIQSYSTALQYRKDYPDAYNGRGSVYAKLGQKEKAYADFNKSIELDSSYSLAYKNRASAYFLENKYMEAIEDYKRYIDYNDQDAEGWSNLCVVYLNKGDNQEAIKICEQAIQRDPKFAKAYTNIGAAYINLNDFGKAIEYLNRSFQLDSLSEENLKFLSLAYLKNKDTTKAYSIFEYAQKIKQLK